MALNVEKVNKLSKPGRYGDGSDIFDTIGSD
jgi:hypothetical protein